MFGLFSKPRLSVEAQLKELETAGLRLTSGLSVDSLFVFDQRTDMEKEPYNGIIGALGYGSEDGKDTPFCSRLWMCDYECIGGGGSYVDIMRRLQEMSDWRPALGGIQDSVDFDDSTAWVEFDLNNKRIHWDIAVDNDWLDPNVLVKYDALLAEHTDLRIYSNHTDFGQTALIGCFTKSQYAKFRKLSKVNLIDIAEQA